MAAYDVVVAGGGPAGLQFAREVGSRAELSVAVLERHDELSDNDKSTGGTFHQVVDGFDIPDRVVMDSADDVIFEGPEERGRLDLPNYVLDFPAFLAFLGDDARADGVEVLTGAEVAGPIVEDGVVTGVRTRGAGTPEEVHADIVVDATGPAGALTADLGMWDPDAAQTGVGKEFEAVGTFEHDSMLFRFDHEVAPGGYAWVFPAGDGVFKIGVCWVNDFYERHSPPDDGAIDDYVRAWVETDDRWRVDEVRDVHAGRVASDNSINRRADDGIVAIGDAVSSVNPLFGEGIRPAMESARMAADVVLDALDRGDTSRDFLARYERRWNEQKGSKWKTQRMVGELLYDFTAAQQNTFVRSVDEMTEAQARRLQRYELTVGDLLQLYPFSPRDVTKAPTLARHLL